MSDSPLDRTATHLMLTELGKACGPAAKSKVARAALFGDAPVLNAAMSYVDAVLYGHTERAQVALDALRSLGAGPKP